MTVMTVDPPTESAAPRSRAHRNIVLVRDLLACAVLALTMVILIVVVILGARGVTALMTGLGDGPAPAPTSTTCYIGDSRPECAD